jgi:hypothetical protein
LRPHRFGRVWRGIARRRSIKPRMAPRKDDATTQNPAAAALARMRAGARPTEVALGMYLMREAVRIHAASPSELTDLMVRWAVASNSGSRERELAAAYTFFLHAARNPDGVPAASFGFMRRAYREGMRAKFVEAGDGVNRASSDITILDQVFLEE